MAPSAPGAATSTASPPERLPHLSSPSPVASFTSTLQGRRHEAASYDLTAAATKALNAAEGGGQKKFSRVFVSF